MKRGRGAAEQLKRKKMTFDGKNMEVKPCEKIEADEKERHNINTRNEKSEARTAQIAV